MSENTGCVKYRNTEPRLFSPDLKRKPLRNKAKKEEEDNFHENKDPNSHNKSLYPTKDIEKDLKEIKEDKGQKETERRLKRALPKNNYQAEHAVKSKEDTSKSSDVCSLRNIIILLLSVLVLLFSYCGYSLYQSEKPAADKTLTEFIADVKNKFEEQHHLTFHILKTSLKRVYNENSKPAAPSIIIILTNKGAENTASKFCSYIARELAFENYISINESSIHSTPEVLKYDIDTKIKSKFDNRSLNVAVIDKFHNIPIDAAMIFHSYCDHDNAPFKRAIFFFIVYLDREIPENSGMKTIDVAATEALRNIWSDASDDKVDSLITRLTGHVINIK